MKEILILLVIAAGLIFYIAHRNSEFSITCHNAGGVPSIGQYANVCYSKNSVIDIQNMPKL